MSIRVRRRFLSLVAVAIGAMAAACLSVSPPLPTVSPTRPAILHDAVVPTASALLVEWPEDNTFIVPVAVGPGESFFYDVFVDYDADAGASPTIPPQAEATTPESLDSGLFMVQFVLPPPDPRLCHTIDFLVAHAFSTAAARTADSVGGDIVTWLYTAGDASGCAKLDAGPLPSAVSDAETADTDTASDVGADAPFASDAADAP